MLHAQLSVYKGKGVGRPNFIVYILNIIVVVDIEKDI